MEIRTACIEDLGALTAIYNEEAEHGTATFDIHPKTEEQMLRWFYDHNKDHHPLIVATEGSEVAGYASLSPYREKEAYLSTVELSVYVARDHRRKGVAGALMTEILKMAREDEMLHTVVSVITSGNEASIHLHQRFGFRYSGTLHDVGMKFGSYLSIDNFELQV